MSIFGSGVGGGMLAAAGGLQGLGQGVSEAGQQQQKVDLETKMNDLQQKREEAITRLQGSQQSALETQRTNAENARTDKEIAGHSAVAQFEASHQTAEAEKQRNFTGAQNTQHQASQEKIASGHDAARVAASQNRASGSTKAPPKEWTPRTLTLQGSFDPVSKSMIPGRQMSVMTHRDGSTYVQVGDKYIPYDGSKENGLSVDPASLRRAPAGAVSALVQNPLGQTPSGMPMKDSFVQRYGYLPAPYLTAAQQARDQVNSKGAAPGAAQGAPGSAQGGGVDDTQTAPENEDPAETEPDPGQPQQAQ